VEEGRLTEEKLLEALSRGEELDAEVQAARQQGIEEANKLRDQVLSLEKVISDMEAARSAEEARRTAASAEEAARLSKELEDQVSLAKKKLKEEEAKDREEAKAQGKDKVTKSAAAKEAYWDVERLSRELEGKEKEIEAAKVNPKSRRP
jgi:hypothetical protein